MNSIIDQKRDNIDFGLRPEHIVITKNGSNFDSEESMELVVDGKRYWMDFNLWKLESIWYKTLHQGEDAFTKELEKQELTSWYHKFVARERKRIVREQAELSIKLGRRQAGDGKGLLDNIIGYH